jgi:hypothetical protein
MGVSEAESGLFFYDRKPQLAALAIFQKVKEKKLWAVVFWCMMFDIYIPLLQPSVSSSQPQHVDLQKNVHCAQCS